MDSEATRPGFGPGLLDAVLRSTPDIVVAIDAAGVVGYVNDTVDPALGYGVDEWLGRSVLELIHPDDRATAMGRLAERLDGRVDHQRVTEVRLRDADGEWIPFEAASTERIDHGDVEGLVVVLRDLRPRLATERQLADAAVRVQQAASHDALTDLPNRAALLEHLEMVDDRRNDGPNHVLVVRVCNLDEIRDRHGRNDADGVVRSLAWAVRSAVRPPDFVAAERTSELAVVLGAGTDHDDATAVGERIRELAQRTLAERFIDIDVTVSIGMADDDLVSPEQALDEAGVAARWACTLTEREPVAFSAEMRARLESRRRLTTELAIARRNAELELHHQPIVSASDRRVEGFEALLRWRHPSRGLISAGEFIHEVEGTSAMEEVGAFVNESAAKQLAILQTAAPESSVYVSINVSPQQLLRGSFTSELAAALERRGADPARLVVELTETFAADHDGATARELAALRDLGVRVALDDFGTGFSSLRHLHAIGADVLKIDRSFVARLGEDEGTTAITRASIELADAFGMHCVAEGVETEGQLDMLRELGCPSVQGHLIGRPVEGFDAVRLAVDGGSSRCDTSV